MAARPDDAILSLPVDELLALVDAIWESIREDAEAVPVDEETKAEMQRRLTLHRDDPESAGDLDVVLARLRAGDGRSGHRDPVSRRWLNTGRRGGQS